MVDPNLAAVLALIGVIAQGIIGAVVIILTRQNGIQAAATHDLVNGQSEKLNTALVGQAHAEGVLAGLDQKVTTIANGSTGNH